MDRKLVNAAKKNSHFIALFRDNKIIECVVTKIKNDKAYVAPVDKKIIKRLFDNEQKCTALEEIGHDYPSPKNCISSHTTCTCWNICTQSCDGDPLEDLESFVGHPVEYKLNKEITAKLLNGDYLKK